MSCVVVIQGYVVTFICSHSMTESKHSRHR